MKSGLVLIDIQNDYFTGGKFELEGGLEASLKASQLLSFYRQQQLPVFHLQHLSIRQGATFFFPNTPGAEFHPHVRPLEGEVVIHKHHPNCFRDSLLQTELQQQGVEHLVVCGMMTHMAIDATVRAAYDMGFQVTVIADACATRSLTFRNVTVSAFQVHSASLAALGYLFANIQTADEWIANFLHPQQEDAIAVSYNSPHVLSH
ncbi:MAG TPA: cysteine hydrolase family protein [Coleofasciculaceae cyanobacterium]